MEGIKNSINNASDNTLVKAGIVNISASESRLVLTTINTGASQDIQVTDVNEDAGALPGAQFPGMGGTVAEMLDVSNVVQTPQSALEIGRASV